MSDEIYDQDLESCCPDGQVCRDCVPADLLADVESSFPAQVEDDPLAGFRGLLIGSVFGLLCWGALGWWLFR